jgi:hypothetical protein
MEGWGSDEAPGWFVAHRPAGTGMRMRNKHQKGGVKEKRNVRSNDYKQFQAEVGAAPL